MTKILNWYLTKIHFLNLFLTNLDLIKNPPSEKGERILMCSQKVQFFFKHPE